MNPDRVEFTFDMRPLTWEHEVLVKPALKKNAALENDNETKNTQSTLDALLSASTSLKRSDVQKVLGVSKATATKLVDALVQKGVLEKRGIGRATYYVVTGNTTENYTR